MNNEKILVDVTENIILTVILDKLLTTTWKVLNSFSRGSKVVATSTNNTSYKFIPVL